MPDYFVLRNVLHTSTHLPTGKRIQECLKIELTHSHQLDVKRTQSLRRPGLRELPVDSLRAPFEALYNVSNSV